MSRARAVIVENQSVALIYREKMQDQQAITYFVFPGGGLEPGETPEEGVVREVQEELGLQVEVVAPFCQLHGETTEHFFLCKRIAGEFGTGTGPEFSGLGEGAYTPMWVSLKELAALKVLPEEVKQKVMRLT